MIKSILFNIKQIFVKFQLYLINTNINYLKHKSFILN